MVKSSDEPKLLDRIRYSAHRPHASHKRSKADDCRSASPLDEAAASNAGPLSTIPTPGALSNATTLISSPTNNDVAEKPLSGLPTTAPPPLENGDGEASASIAPGAKEKQPNVITRFYRACKDILFSSWLNILLVFVPVGIIVQAAGVNKTIVFAMNAIAIIPLAGLLSHATESVASELGDTVGALMNITFGNAVELIILQNEIEIVQASLLGSILANLLLILGMCFLVGGLRFREQIYNSTVTQMSACLLSLSVMSLLLPTAFHASFTNTATADHAVLQISRGTSIILLLVYVLYLLFQLKSHAYMYQSMPQHKIDEESHPGILAEMLGSSSSSDGSSSSSGSDTDGSSGSNTTAKRIRRVLRGRKRRKSSASSKDTPSGPSTTRTPSTSTFTQSVEQNEKVDHTTPMSPAMGAIASGDEADTDGENDIRPSMKRNTTINFRDFENEKESQKTKSTEAKARRKSKRKDRKAKNFGEEDSELSGQPQALDSHMHARTASPRVGFSDDVQALPESSPKRPFNFRGRSVLDVVPAMPKVLSSTVFSTSNPTTSASGPLSGPPIVGTPRALHRSSSLPSRLNQVQAGRQQSNTPAVTDAAIAHGNLVGALDKEEVAPAKKYMSRTAAIILLLVSTGLVAVCAEFLVSSIDYLVDNTDVSEAFVGLIILPIVGNAAEHVTAVVVASKNKMDLAIGVALGSSIQIALFVTPVIVLLGWILNKDMSLYFSLFETISLFVSAFIVNFLVLDGRSNYLEGALLIAAYVIIALAAFFFPDSDEQSTIGGGDAVQRLLKMT